MERALTDRPALTLYELNSLIKSAISYSFPDTYWVIAEIAELKCNQKGHCYLELVERQDKSTIAQIKANIWAYEYRNLSLKFEKATDESLKAGMKVLFVAAVTFHEVYGLSLNIKDIDPAYTLGEMARKKKEVIERLKKEGIIDKNKCLAFPLVPQRISVISSPTAAGYEDFFNQLDNNPYGYKFIHTLFPALMQGQEAERSIISALNEIKKQKHLYDAAVIIRGGGSVIDLSCFDSYAVASEIALFPLPVISGIGHEKDYTVVDLTAHTRMKTPTAVAELLIAAVRGFEERIMDLRDMLRTCAERSLKDERHGLDAISKKLIFIPVKLSTLNNRLSMLMVNLKVNAQKLFREEDSRLDSMQQAARLLDPANVLKRGYSITHHNGNILRDASLVKKGDLLETKLHIGAITSIAQKTTEDKHNEQVQTAYLFPGIDRA